MAVYIWKPEIRLLTLTLKFQTNKCLIICWIWISSTRNSDGHCKLKDNCHWLFKLSTKEKELITSRFTRWIPAWFVSPRPLLASRKLFWAKMLNFFMTCSLKKTYFHAQPFADSQNYVLHRINCLRRSKFQTCWKQSNFFNGPLFRLPFEYQSILSAIHIAIWLLDTIQIPITWIPTVHYNYIKKRGFNFTSNKCYGTLRISVIA